MIRPAVAADAAAMADLFAQFEHPTPAEPIPERLARLVAHDGQAFVADPGSGLLGVATTQIVWSLVEDAPRAMLTAHAFSERLGFEFTGRRSQRSVSRRTEQ